MRDARAHTHTHWVTLPKGVRRKRHDLQRCWSCQWRWPAERERRQPVRPLSTALRRTCSPTRRSDDTPSSRPSLESNGSDTCTKVASNRVSKDGSPFEPDLHETDTTQTKTRREEAKARQINSGAGDCCCVDRNNNQREAERGFTRLTWTGWIRPRV
jgi:hypothetical protein